MGMFTSIEHPVDGREVQIKIGDDRLDNYKIGDVIDWWKPTRWNVDSHPDGIYNGACYPEKGAYVIIKDLTIVKVEDLEEDTRAQYDRLSDEFLISDPPRSLWKEEWWVEVEEMRRKNREEYEAFEKTLEGKSPEERLGAVFAYPLMRNMQNEGFARAALLPKPVELVDVE